MTDAKVGRRGLLGLLAGFLGVAVGVLPVPLQRDVASFSGWKIFRKKGLRWIEVGQLTIKYTAGLQTSSMRIIDEEGEHEATMTAFGQFVDGKPIFETLKFERTEK